MKLESSYFQAPSSDAIPRPLVIDGCNIGRSASGFSRTHVDCAGLVAVVRWLFTKNFDVTVFLPVVYNNINNYNARNAELLHKLERLGIVTFTPARSGRGLRKAFINYDDLYVVSYAARHGGCILSGDKFKDILHQNCYSDFHNVIRNRTVDVKFHALPLDFVQFEQEMFYKNVPEMFIHESHNMRSTVIRQKLFVRPAEEDYQLVEAHRRLLSADRRKFLCSELDALLISISLAAGKEFRKLDELTLLDASTNSHHALRIEDLFSPEVCREFYKKYPKNEILVSHDAGFQQDGEDSAETYVMEPIVEVGDFDWRQKEANNLIDISSPTKKSQIRKMMIMMCIQTWHKSKYHHQILQKRVNCHVIYQVLHFWNGSQKLRRKEFETMYTYF
ncbi:unnamed protein product [Caenorhabditis angaria]|uniref:RNase NYN domain-containing protein n=1 Tax=Caenorhabditis angaria TaxID=860376 RepID=A0A9P1IDL9_9PELO|nr:unnamed protein product [Caenorhabditis angaria]